MRLLMSILLLGFAGCTDGGGFFAQVSGSDHEVSESGGLESGGSESGGSGSSEARVLVDDSADGPARCVVKADVDLAEQLVRLINLERLEAGVVRSSAMLDEAAEQYSCEMVKHAFFGHEHPCDGSDVVTRVESVGYDFSVVGENLAAGLWSASDILDAWLESAAHREILLDPEFSEIGVAVRKGGPHGIYAVLILAAPAK